jgi:hypothetical protein
MVRVPAGEFYYGCSESVGMDGDDDQEPGKKIALPECR